MTRRASKNSPAIVWFRDDLRLGDHAALSAACNAGAPVLCVYILDEASEGVRPLGGAARWWLHFSLGALAKEIEAKGGRLDLFRGRAQEIIPGLAGAADAAGVFWTRRYGAAEIAVDAAIKAQLAASGVKTESFNGQLLHEPWEVKRADGGGFALFSPYWRAARGLPEPGAPLKAPAKLLASSHPTAGPPRKKLAELDLLPQKPDWAAGLRASWTPGERGARGSLSALLDGGLKDYAAGRDEPAKATSRLSPHLRFGEISPRQIFAAIAATEERRDDVSAGAEKFRGELFWREFNYHLLFHCPDAANRNLQRRFDAMPWRDQLGREVDAWRRGETGYPLVDAGMRELWSTGFMHNRARMVAASFLVKHLLIDWRIGEAWFWDALCDADPANNPLNWQWVAGSGADAAPYFRVFNPALQGERFDLEGAYVRRWVPELSAMPNRWIHKPWLAPQSVLQAAGVELSKTYPAPIIDHAEARARALAAFAMIRG
jgi:deoxyribodipyrimidine photo-lyase